MYDNNDNSFDNNAVTLLGFLKNNLLSCIEKNNSL